MPDRKRGSDDEEVPAHLQAILRYTARRTFDHAALVVRYFLPDFTGPFFKLV